MKNFINKCLKNLGYRIEKIKKQPSTKIYSSIYSNESLKERRFYNIGAGDFQHPYWTNIDFENEWYAKNNKYLSKGINYDIMSLQPLPLTDNSAEVVYTSHTIEHINDEAAQNIFNESFRILKKGGYFRLTTPNILLEYRAYLENDRNYFYWVEKFKNKNDYEKLYTKALTDASIEQIFLSHFASNVSTLHKENQANHIQDDELKNIFKNHSLDEALNYCTKKCSLEVQKRNSGDHINWWHFEKASRMLKLAGFHNIYLSGYGQSFCPILRDTLLFDNTHPKISLYVEARKI